MSRRIVFFLTGSGIFLFFVFFSYLVHKNLFTHFDFNMTVRLQDHMPRRFDGLFSLFSLIGQFEVMIIVLLAIIALTRKLWGVAAFVMFGMMHVVEIYGKFFVEHSPPPHFMLRTERIGNFPQFYISAENSYPSGHAGRAAFLSVILGFVIWRSQLSLPVKVGLLGVLGVYDVIMLVSRVYLGEHWTSDIIGGTLLGASLACLSFVLLREKKSAKTH